MPPPQNPQKPKSEVVWQTDFELSLEPTIESSLEHLRDGCHVEQTFRVPRGGIGLGTILVHRQTMVVMKVISQEPSGEFRLQNLKTQEETLADVKLLKQTCWAMAETIKPG